MISRLIPLALLLPTLLLAQDGPLSPGVKFLTPEEAIEKMSYPEGFGVVPAAAEPEVVQPFAFTFDARGRIWLCENLNYETRGSDSFDSGPKGRIIILEDSDGDGRFEKKTLFKDNIFFPSGIAVGFGGVWVGSPPHLLFIPDRDGDDRPDGEAEIVLDGWGRQDRHETLNSFIWGPDGWLYGLQGIFTQSRVGKPGTPDADRVPINAGVWRYHPTQKKFEVFSWGTSNPWGMDFNEHGQLFETACVIPHLWHMVQGGRYHRQAGQHFNPHVYDDIKTIADHSHASAHGGARFYLADQFPEKYRGQLFMCNIHEHGVLTDVLSPRGSGFTGTHGEHFCMANDNQWLGFNMELGPDGSIYVLDWHDEDICGRKVVHAETGRIWRISYGDAKNPKFDLAKNSDLQLAATAVDAPNEWHSRQARLLLQQRATLGAIDAAAVAKLNAALATETNTAKKLRALWSLHITGSIDQGRLGALLDHADEHLRGWAIRLLADGGIFPQKLAEMASRDPSPVVRLFLSSAAQRMAPEQRWPIMENLAGHRGDSADHNLPLMNWYALEPLVIDNPDRAIKLAGSSQIPLLSRYVARRLSSELKSEVSLAAQGFVREPAVGEIAESGLVLHLSAEDLETEGKVASWGEAKQNAAVSQPEVRRDLGGRRAVHFDGMDDRLELPQREDLCFATDADFSLAVSIYYHEPRQDGWRGVVTKSRAAGNWYGIWSDNGRWRAGSSGTPPVDAGPASPGWQHLCVVQASGERRIYQDGYLISKGAASDGSGTGNLWIGGAESVEEFFRGGIGELRIYRRALTAGEVSRLAGPVDKTEPTENVLSRLVTAITNCEPPTQLAIMAGIREGLAGNRSIGAPRSWQQVYPSLAASADPAVKDAARELSVLFGNDTALAGLRAVMKNAALPADERARALATLIEKRVSGLAADLHPLLDEPSMRSATLQGLSATPDAATPAEILGRYAGFSPQERSQAINTLSGRAASGLALLNAVESGKIPRKEISPAAARQLANLGDKTVAAKLAEVWGSIGPKSGWTELRGHFETALRPELLAKADPANGRRVFQQSCAACHQMFGEGGTLAPDLTGSDRRNVGYILDNVLEPNADIGKDYQYSTFTLKDERVLLGIIKAENDSSITVNTIEGEQVIAKTDLKARQQLPVSMMPEGLFQNLTEDEVRDLMRYLQSDQQVPQE